MNQVIALGLTGCQLIQLHAANLILVKAGLDLIEAVDQTKMAVKRSVLSNKEIKELQAMILTAGETESPFRMPIREKKPRYVRQQHKLAQMHYRRK